MTHKRSPEALLRRKQTWETRYYQKNFGCNSASEVKTFDVAQSFRTYVTASHGNVKAFSALRKAEGGCAYCGQKTNLHVHHKDGNHSNNRHENLIVLCQPCHMERHKEMRIDLSV